MKNCLRILGILFSTIFCSCTSFSDNVKANKEKFIQVGIENSQPVDVNNLESIYESAQANNTEAKTKFLRVEKLESNYQDSVVLFVNGNELAIYDFANNEREMNFIGDRLKLNHIEKVHDRLFFGKR